MDGICDVVLPALDERAALPWVLGRMPPGYRLIVVDNGSTDLGPMRAAPRKPLLFLLSGALYLLRGSGGGSRS